MEFEGENSEGLIDYKSECDKKEEIIQDLKKKLGEYAKRTMILINEKNELKKLLESSKGGEIGSGKTLLDTIPGDHSPSNQTPELLVPAQAEKLTEIKNHDGMSLIDYKGEVEKRDRIILEMDAKFKEYAKKTMQVINERNALKAELENLKSKTQNLESKEGKIEGIWKRKLLEAERKVRAVEKILEQKNRDLSTFQSRYIAELTEKDKKIQELLIKVTKLEAELKSKTGE
ncbi:MAG: hypothetical protein ACTSRG_20115 [Candidatus Helarchaeota archaeon]